eukprot:251469-Pelagomonas_calceolata.AAC.3
MAKPAHDRSSTTLTKNSRLAVIRFNWRPPAFARQSPQPTLTMYSAGATYSTVPPLSSGRMARSVRWPVWSKWLKYSTGTSFRMWHTLHLYLRPMACDL